MSSNQSPPCRFRLDDSTSSTLTLPDGRKLGYAEYGNPTGHPILYYHGFPGSRIEATTLDATASKLNARIISIDRPGIGWSSPHPTRTYQSYAEDVKVLTDHLSLKQYSILGISGGGPYALACAYYLPSSRLRSVSIVCGLGSPDMGYWGIKWLNWAGWTFGHRWFPRICRWWFSRDPVAQLHLTDEERLKTLREGFEKDKNSIHPKDVSLLGDQDGMLMHVQRGKQIYEQGLDGLLLDCLILSSEFGFRIEDIRKDLPVHLWYGKLDVFVPLRHGEKTAARLGENAVVRVEDETHVGISENWKEEYIAQLVKDLQA